MADYSLIEGALQRGYSMDEIADKLAQAEGFDPSAIRARGYGAEDIIGRLGYVKPEEVKPEKGFIGNVLDQAAHGVKTAYQGLLSAPGIYAGNPDAERIAGTIQAEQSHEKPKEMREAEAAFAGVSKRQSDFESVYGKDSGYMDSIGKIMDMLVTTGKEIVTNPKGMAYEMASQSGNMVAPMVGAYAGGKTGAVTGALLGPKGAVAGGVVGAGAGGFAGSHVMEQSGEFRGKVAERLSELGLEPTAENVSAIFQDKAWLDKTLEETRDKATGTAVTDGVLAAIGGLAVNAPIRAAQKTARAQLGATATAKQVSDAAADILASQPKWQKVAPHLKAGAIGWGGEPISEATGQQYGYGHVDYGDVGMEAFAAAGEGIGSVYAAAKGMRTKPTLPANVTPPPSITSASSTDDAIKAFKDEVETVSPAPRGSFSGMDDLAGLIESERSDLGKRRGLLAQQQQEARDMEAEFSGLVKDEQIDQSYRLNDAQKQRDAERAREGGYDLALQQREEQQGRTVEQLAAASEAQGFGNEEPTAMQLAMQQAQQKALDNEFSGLLKQERASLNEMRANVKRVAGVPVEQISTPQLEEIAQSEAHPNTKMAAVAALNDRHDAIQQERERLMQLREARLERQADQSVQGEQPGAVPDADNQANVKALTENAAKRQATQLTNQGYPTVAYPHPTQSGMWAIGLAEEAKTANLTQNDAPSRPSASWDEQPAIEVKQPIPRKKPSPDNIAHAIINMGGVSTSLKNDILGDAATRTRPGFFTSNGTTDLGALAARLSGEFGFSQINLNDATGNSGAKQLADLIARAVNGESILNEEAMIRAQEAEEVARHQDDINRKAEELGIKPSGRGRPFSKVEAEVLKLMEIRLNKEIEEAGTNLEEARAIALRDLSEEQLTEIQDKAMDALGENPSILETYRALAAGIKEAVNENERNKKDDTEGSRSGIEVAGAGHAEEASRPATSGTAREGQSAEAEVTPEFGLVGQTEAEARAEQERLNQPEGLTREQIDREATAPFSLHSDVMPPSEGPSGETSSMFTPDGRATVAAEANRPAELSKGDRFKDAAGNEWEVWASRHGSVEAHPVINGKPQVNRDTSTMFAVDDGAKERHPDRRQDVFPFGHASDPIAAVKATLDAAGVTGTDRTTTIAAVRRGDLTPEDVAEAHPAIAENSERVNTEDAGEELRANRRNRSGSLKWSDIKDQEAALRVKEVTKAKVYQKPDYAALAEEIGPVKAHLVKQVYDHIAATPQTGRDVPTDAQLEAYIDAVNSIMDATIAWAKDAVFESQWRMTANGKTLVDTLYPEGWRPQRDVVVLLGGNRHFGGVQPGYKEIKRAEREIAKGWPGKREAWQTQGYKVVETAETAKLQEGRSSGNKVYYIEVGGRYFDSAPSKADGEKMIAEMQPWLLLNKQGRIVSQHQSEEQAVEAARNATKRGGSGGISDKGIAVENAERVGPARRMEGENVTSDQLKETFGFRGVNFGTWMKGKANDGERQLHLNHAYDAFLDLAEIIGVQPKAMSLNGMLGLAIGAQGNGKYAAHFVPGVNEINLTRTSGAGSLAHEFGHALDHYFARLGGLDRQAEPFLTEHTGKPAQGELRPEILDKFDSIVKEMNKRKMTPEEYEAEHLRNVERFKKNIAGWLKAVRHDFEIASINKVTIEDGKAKREKAISKLDALIERIRDKDLGDGRIAIGRYESASPVVMEIRELYKETFGRQMPKNNILGLQSNIDSLVYATSKRDADNSHTPQVSTDYAKNALSLDKDKGGKPYWSTNLEKFARAFDAFVTDTLDAKAAKNSYLSHAGREGATVPAGEERKAINEAFKALVDAIETKETDSGVAMFNAKSGSIGNPIDAAALESTIASVIAASPSQWSRDTVVTATLFSELPAPIVEKAKAEGYDAHGRNRDGQKLTGATYDGKVYLVQENISSEIEAEETLLHERIHQILHGNAEDKNGKALRKSLGRLYSRIGGKDAIVSLAKRVGADLSGPLAALPRVAMRNRPAFLVDEFLAHVEGQRAYEKFPQSVVRAIREFYGEFRDWLRSSKFVKIADAVGVNIGTFTQSDLSWTLKKIRQQQAGTGSKAIRFMTAWHGSPHDHDGLRTPFDRIDDSPEIKSLSDGMVADAKLLADFAHTESFIKKGFRGFDVPAQLAQLRRVIRLVEHDKIRQVVVQSIPVDMMDMLIGRQLTPEMLLHDVSVFRNLLSVDSNNPVSLPVDVSSRLANVVAIAAAKVANLTASDVARAALKGDAAMVANKGSAFSPALNRAVNFDGSIGSLVGNAEASSADAANNIFHDLPQVKDGDVIPNDERIVNSGIFDDADVKITAKESRRASNDTTPENAGVSVSAPSESVRRIQSVVERFKAQFKGADALDIRVVSTTQDIPPRFRPSPFAEGVFHDDAGLIYLVASNLRDQVGQLNIPRAWQVLMHESVGHFGLAQMMGDRFNGVLKQVMKAARAKGEVGADIYQPGHADYATVEAVRLRYPEASDVEVAQEVLARMAEEDKVGTTWSYVRGLVRQWLRDVARAMGFTVEMTTEELNDLVAKASGYMRRGGNLAEERVPSGLVAASQKVGAYKAVDTTSASFLKWFGDSKVVDAYGKPLVVYHGTPKVGFTEFGTNNVGAFFSDRFDIAASYAGRYNEVEFDGEGAYTEDGTNQGVYETYLSIKNPLVVDWGGKLFADGPDGLRTDDIAARAKREGYDGLVIENVADVGPISPGIVEDNGVGRVYVAFSPTQIKSAISNTGEFNDTNPSILESRARPGTNEAIWDAPDPTTADNVIYTLQDKHIDLKRVQQAIKSAVGEIRDDIDAYLQEELFHGRAAKITEEFLDKEVNPLISLMRASKVSMDELETFLWARHAKERNAQIAKINDEMPDGGSGLTNKQADDLMAGKDVTIGDKTIEGVKPNRKELLSNLAGRVDAITRGNRALLERYSLESADTLNAWDGAYKHYVPLHREDAESHLAGMGTGQGYSVKGSSSKRATGSSRPVENILANLALQRERIITRGEKNRVAQSLYGLAKEMPNADLWEVDVKPTMKTVAFIGGQEQVVDAIDPAFRSKPNVVFARFNGEDRFVVFNEHNERALRMAEALKNLDADDISHLLGEVSRWTRYFASINTQYNPIFGVTNLVRDVQTGLLNLKSTPIAGKQKEMMGHLTHALPAVFKALRADRKGQAAPGSWAQLWEEFQEVGGQTGYRDMFRNSQERAEALQNALDPTWWQKTWWGKAATVGGVLAVPEQAFLDKVGKPLMELLSDYNTMMENGIRLAAYKVALDTGMTQARAASLAKNLTVNFNRKGQAARQVGSLYAFFNASVQGTARMAETLNHGAKPGELLGKAGKQIVYGGLLLGAVQAMLLMAAGFDDEDPPEFVRDRNIIIPTGNGKYVSIPMPLGFHVLPAISRISIEFTAGGFKKPGEHLVHIMDVLLDSFNPIGNAGLSMQTVAPTVLDPIAALTENKDWSGRQIARQDFSKLNPTPGYTRAKDTASSLSRGLAYAFNYLSGGGEYGIGIVSPTPDQIDYLLGQLTGGVGRELGKVLTTGETMATGEDLPPHKIPLVGRFYGDTTGQSSEASKFYGTLEKLSEHKGTLDRMKDAHDLEAYREYAKEHPESRFYDRANKVQRELSSLRKLKRKMIERDADRAKVRQIEDRMRTLMTRFNQSVSEQKGDH